MKTAVIIAVICFLLSFFGATFPGNTNQVFVSALSRVTGIVPFSLFEFLVCLGFIFIIFQLGRILALILKKNPKAALSPLKSLITFICLLYSAFVLIWGLNYNNLPLHYRLGLDRQPQDAQELARVGRLLAGLANEAREKTRVDENGAFYLHLGFEDIFERAHYGFDAVSSDFGFLEGSFGPPKPLWISPLLSYTFITGIYSPFTGEANVNINTPPATVIFTTMHEMAHQRGIAREDEANFIAFLTSINHPDPDFRYSGYLNALNYVRRALATVAPPYLDEVNAMLSEGVRLDINQQITFWNAYRGRTQEIANRINDNYLRFNGIAEGTLSYGLVVDLLLAYFQ
ncbi:MAG: DUF3810 domain-containing protein [Turicibacter sp.]|nr:DUF3810 domain-containing protein [Turicibacter sp.]